jgi:hypothetical protein
MRRNEKIEELNAELKAAQDAVAAENKLAFSPKVAVLRDVVFKLLRRIEHIKASMYKS